MSWHSHASKNGFRPFALFLIVCSAVGGCASGGPPYERPVVHVSEPPPGSSATVTVGNPMLRRSVYTEYEILQVDKAFEFFAFGTVTVNPGAYVLFNRGNDKEKRVAYFFPSNLVPALTLTPGSFKSGFFVNDALALVVYDDDSRVCVLLDEGGRPCKSDLADHYHRETIRIIASDVPPQSLVYAGLIDDRVRFVFREESFDVASSEKNRDLEFAWTGSLKLEVEGAVLNITDAKRDSVTYEVISGFDNDIAVDAEPAQPAAAESAATSS